MGDNHHVATEASTLDEARLRRLIAVGRSLLSELRLEPVLDRLLDTARDLTDARYAALGILNEDRTELRRFVTRGIDADTQRSIGALPRGRGVLGALIDDPRPLRLSNVRDHAKSYGFPTGHPPMSSFLGVPIVIRGEVWGNIYLTDKVGGADFDAGDEESIVVLAAWAGLAIDNARLYERLDARNTELERAVRGLEATSAIAQALGTETDLDRVLELIVKRARALVDARSVLVLLAHGEDLVIAAAAGQAAPAAERLPAAETRCGDVLKTRSALRIADVDADGHLDSAQLGVPDASSALLVPLVYRGKALGVLSLFDRMTGDASFSGEDEGVMRSFAASAAIAVATARTVQADRLRSALASAEGERRRWARELHDETLQALGALKVMLSTAAREPDPERMRTAIAQTADQVAGEIHNLRALISELRPASLDALGLAPALRTLVEQQASQTGLAVEAHISLGDDAERLPPELETTIYRVAQEALTNVLKHARATTVQVHVRRDDGDVRLIVRDDGVGFDPSEPTTGFGLLGIRERVALAGGTAELERADPGTLLMASFPIDQV